MHRLKVKNQYNIDKEKENKEVSKKSTGRLIKFLLIITVTTIIIFLLAWASAGNHEVRYREIKVESGQSLWEIARDNYSQKYDLRKVIYQIKKINNLDNVVLHPGQSLKIPIE